MKRIFIAFGLIAVFSCAHAQEDALWIPMGTNASGTIYALNRDRIQVDSGAYVAMVRGTTDGIMNFYYFDVRISDCARSAGVVVMRGLSGGPSSAATWVANGGNIASNIAPVVCQKGSLLQARETLARICAQEPNLPGCVGRTQPRDDTREK